MTNQLMAEEEAQSSDFSFEELTPAAHCCQMGPAEHFVQFYEQDGALIDSLTEFVGAGLRAGEGQVVIATSAHLQALADRLDEDGFDLSKLQVSGQFAALDAAATLSQFMIAGMPDRDRFRKMIEPVLVRAAQGDRRVKAFGEMVALLWAEGNGPAALQLEELWNRLARTHPFSLFCAYPINGFRGENNGKVMEQVCRAHSRVIPSESYTMSKPDERLRTIALLQQKAASLEAEIAVRKEAERVLLQRDRELSDFLENATEAIHKVGPDGTIIWANRAELELLGYSKEEYIGRNIAEFHADTAVIADILERLNRGEQLREYEARLKHRDGSIRDVAINSSVYWEDGRFGHTKCFTRDITDRKRAAATLERTVAERTAQLQDKMAELEAFSYSISHDMRSPLRAMEGYAKALLKEYGSKLGAEGVVYLERIQRAASRLDGLIRDVLAYSKIAKEEVNLESIALDRLLDDIIQERPEFQNARKHISIQQPLHPVIGHQAYLTQVFTNLLDNALKFVAPGVVPQVRIHSERVGAHVRVWVSDNGIGIHPEHYDRIFEMFGRVYSEKQYPGTGIGLALVKKAVMRMGGEVGFDSVPGKGSDFWFTIPLN